MTVGRVEEWHRVHGVSPPVTFSIFRSPLDGDWLVRVDGWELPRHFQTAHSTVEAAQRTADDVLINYRPHDCKREGCGDWKAIRSTTCHTTSGATTVQ